MPTGHLHVAVLGEPGGRSRVGLVVGLVTLSEAQILELLLRQRRRGPGTGARWPERDVSNTSRSHEVERDVETDIM